MNAHCLLNSGSSSSKNPQSQQQQHRPMRVGGSLISAHAYGVPNAVLNQAYSNNNEPSHDQAFDTAFDQDFLSNDFNIGSANDRSLSLGFGDHLTGLAQEGQGQVLMLQGGQAQGQGFQSQNASSIMQNNMSMNGNDFGFIDEPSAIEAHLDRISSDEIQPMNAGQQSQFSQQSPLLIEQSRGLQNQQHLQQQFVARTDETANANSQNQINPLAEVRSLRHILNSLSAALGCVNNLQSQLVVQHPQQIQSMLAAALKHQSNLQEAILAQKQTQSEWRQAFKAKVRVKLNQFKEQKKQELQKAEELKFKQQINEFELHARVTSLEQAYSRQEEEINKQANDNEILKFEKMKLIQQHSKRLVQIENAIAQIQIQKSAEIGRLVEYGQNKKQESHARGHSSAEMTPKVVQCEVYHSNRKVQQPRQPPDSQSDKKRKASELSRSFCNGERLDSFENQGKNRSPSLQALRESNGKISVGTQLCNLKNLIREFKHISDQQRREEVKNSQFQGLVDNKPQSCGNDSSGRQPSVSDCDFSNPQQKLMNNYFLSQNEEGEDTNNKNQSSNDVNRAVIMGASKGSAADNEDRETALGDLAQQLNDTSFFAGQGGFASEIQLPDNLNFFNKGNDEIEFHPNHGADSVSKIRQIEDEMACFVDEDLLLSALEHSGEKHEKNKRASNENLDSDDKEVEDLFRDSSADSLAESFKRLTNTQTRLGHKHERKNKSKPCVRDVNLDDLMQASVATDFKPEDYKKSLHKAKDFSKDFLNDGVCLLNEADLSPVQNKSSDKMNFSAAQIIDFDPENQIGAQNVNKAQNKHLNEAEISLALPDLSAIVSEKQDKSNGEQQVVADKVGKFFNDGGSEDEQNLADLNRKLMPNFIVQVGNKQIKMPRLDLQRVLIMYDQNPFVGNIVSQTNQSLETDTILETHKDMKGIGTSQTSGGSFLNETGSKQVQSECPIESLKSKQKESKSESDAKMLDYLNKCDQAISAIIEDAPFDADEDEVEVRGDIMCQAIPSKKQPGCNFEEPAGPIDCNNMLDSLREEIQKEDQEMQSQQSKVQSKHLYGTDKRLESSQKSPTANSMPFELRDSMHSKFTDSNKMRGSSVVTVKYMQSNDKRCLSQVGQKIRQSSVVEEQDKGSAQKNQMHPMMQRNDFTMSQKEFDKKSQMMRLSELDSVSNHLHNKSQKEEVTRTQKFGQIQNAKKIVGVDGVQERNRAPSENQALERQQKTQQEGSDQGGKLLSPHTIGTNNTDSIVGSLQTQSILGDKSRLSAPATIPSKGQRAAAAPRESAYMTEVVKEVEDDDSKILSVNNSSSKLVSNNDETQQSMHMLAYNSAYPHTTKNIRQLKSHYSSQKQPHGQSSSLNQQPAAKSKKTKVSIQRVQHHAEMSSLIKNQKTSSSSIQRLKIVKKVSVNSAAAPNAGLSEQSKREVLSCNSIERPSAGGNSSISLIEQSRIARVNASSVNRDYSSVGPGAKNGQQLQQQENSNPRLSINTRKSKPITVSFKNIVKASMQKRKSSNAGQPTDGESSAKRDDSEQPSSVINLQRVALNPAVASSSSSKPGKISVAGKSEGKTLNITVMRNSKPKDASEQSVVKKQVLRLNQQNLRNELANSSVEETRDGSIVFVHNSKQVRKNTVERVSKVQSQSKRVPSPALTNETNPQTEKEVACKRPSSKQKTKMLIAAHQIKQRKLSIGSANAATSLLKQNATDVFQDADKKSGQRASEVVSGSRASVQEKSKAASPVSLRRGSNKSTGKDSDSHQPLPASSVSNGTRITHQQVETQSVAYKPASKSVKKGSIICLKRRDAAVTEGSQHLNSSKYLTNKATGSERVPSVGPDGNQSSKRSQQMTEAPNLKIKRMTKSNNTKKSASSRYQSRGGSNRPSTVVRCQENNSTSIGTNMISQYASVNQTVCGGVDQAFGQESSLIRELHTNQSNTILGDISLLSKIGADSKGQILVVPNMSYGGTGNQSSGKPTNILINQQNLQQQSSQQNLPSQMFPFYNEGPPVCNSFQVATDTKSAAGGKRIGMSRGSIELSQSQVNHSQVVVASSSNFAASGNKEVVVSNQAGMQISQKAMKIISNQKSKISGAQRQVQMEWKTTGMQQSSNIQVAKHRNSAAPTTDSQSNHTAKYAQY